MAMGLGMHSRFLKQERTSTSIAEQHGNMALHVRKLSPLCDSSKARAKLNWKPAVDFKGLVEMMVDADLGSLTARQHCRAPLA